MTVFVEGLTDRALDDKRQHTDPLADGVIEAIVEERGAEEAKRIFHTLIRHIEMPLDDLPSLVADYMTEASVAPEWAVDDHRLTAERLFVDHGPKLLILLYYKSLPTIYACAKGARVLTGTGRLTHDEQSMKIFSRRVAETAQFLIDVMAPGGMGKGGRGVATTLKVRLVHAAIRKFTRDAGWDAAALGQPINQEDLAATLTTFSYSLIDGLGQLGAPLVDADAEAYHRHWNVVGHFLGIEEDLLAPTVGDGHRLQDAVLRRHAASSEDGALLTKALVAFAEETLPPGRLQQSPRIMIRYLIGRSLADMLEVPSPRRWWSFVVPLFLKRIFGLVERLEDHSEPIEVVSDEISRLAVRGMVGYFNSYKEATLRLPDELREAWGV